MKIKTELLSQLIDLIREIEREERVVVESVSFNHHEYEVMALMEEAKKRGLL
ncbi:MAG TPA: hypothetical protein PLM63_03650 [bacterium]|nr:hypothetical protein [bacterium]